MPANGFSVGHDISIDMVDPVTGAILIFPPATSFNAEPNTKSISSEPLNGPPQYAELPNGWKGSVDFDRTDATIDIFFARNEALYYTGVNLGSGTITATQQERNGATTTWQYTNVAFKLAEAGKWKASEKVSQRIDWFASQRVQIV